MLPSDAGGQIIKRLLGGAAFCPQLTRDFKTAVTHNGSNHCQHGDCLMPTENNLVRGCQLHLGR
jgi:hypothetical protein